MKYIGPISCIVLATAVATGCSQNPGGQENHGAAVVSQRQTANIPATPQIRPVLFREHVPQAVSSKTATRIGTLPASQQLTLAISLPTANEDQLNVLLKQLYDPKSSDYRRYLSAEEFTKRFGPTLQDYEKVIAWARKNGFEVQRTTPSRRVLTVSGTVDTINRALHVRIGTYQHYGENRVFYAPDQEPALDLDVAIYSIAGLEDYNQPRSMLVRDTSRQASRILASGSGPRGMFVPNDIRKAYYGDGPLTGKGQTAGIFSFPPYDPKDLQLYYETAGMTPSVPVVVVSLDKGGDGLCAKACNDGEQILDIGNVVGMAPGLDKVIFYQGWAVPTLDRMATDNTAQVISSSWTGGDFGYVSMGTYKQFVAQGQTFFQASGDSGSYPKGFEAPMLHPYVVNVGGTSLTTNGPGGTWKSEVAWGAGGGGFMPNSYALPEYQNLPNVINASNNGSATWRNGPDVAAEADYDNFLVEAGQVKHWYGGTSFAAPRWAGMIALANEAAGLRMGFLNFYIYGTGGSSFSNTVLHDITQGGNGKFKAVPGYDLVTGWGSPNGVLKISPAAAN